MPNASGNVLDYLRIVSGAWRDDPRDDAELLARFADGGSDDAFLALVWRHGALVWQTCRQVLGNGPDAEDALQAVFLALSRKASKLRGSTLAGWLHRVARQVSLDTQKSVRRRRKLENQMRRNPIQPEGKAIHSAEISIVLDEELANLPERLRVPLILRYLEGKSQEEVARVLGCSRSVVRKRLDRGEEILRKQLIGRGLEANAIAALLAGSAVAPAIPIRLVKDTAHAAMSFRAGTLNGAAAEQAQKLLHSSATKETVQKLWWVMLTSVGLMGIGGVGLVAWQTFGSGSGTVTQAVSDASKTVTPKATVQSHPKRVDCYGDSLPDGAISRIGTVRFRPGASEGDAGDVAFLDGGKTLVSVHSDCFVHFWETATGKELRLLELPAKCRKVAASADGKKLAIIGFEDDRESAGPVRTANVWVWDLAVTPPRQLWQQKVIEGSDCALAFAPNCKTLAVSALSGNEQEILLLNATTGVEQLILKVKKNGHLAFSPNSQILVAGGVLWNAVTGKKLCNLKGLIQDAHALAFSSDGRTLAATHRDGFHIWDVVTETVRCQISDRDQQSLITFLSDGTLLEIPNDENGRIIFRDPVSGKIKNSTRINNSLNLQNVIVCGMCLSPNGKIIAQADRTQVGVWDIATGQEIGPAGADRAMEDLAFSPDKKTIVAITGCGRVRVCEAETGRLCRKERFESSIAGPFDYFDGCRVAIGQVGLNSAIGFVNFDLQSGKLSNDKVPQSPRSVSSPTNYAVSSDGRWQLWGSEERVVVVDRSQAKEVCSFPGLSSPKDLMAVSDDGRSILLCPRRPDATVELGVWSSKTGKQRTIREVNVPLLVTPTVALSPDGRWIAFASREISKDEPAVRLWEVASGTEGECFQTGGVALRSVAWSPDGHSLAGGDAKGDIWVWDVAAGLLFRHVAGHRGGVNTLVFSQDGRQLVSGGYDTTALVWDVSGLPHRKINTTALW